MVQFVAPMRSRIDEILKDRNRLNTILKRGGEQARESAQETVRNAREMVGLRYY